MLLPTLTFVGVTTFERAVRNRVEDAQLAGRINQIRQYYFYAAPQVARYLPPPSRDVPAAMCSGFLPLARLAMELSRGAIHLLKRLV